MDITVFTALYDVCNWARTHTLYKHSGPPLGDVVVLNIEVLLDGKPEAERAV